MRPSRLTEFNRAVNHITEFLDKNAANIGPYELYASVYSLADYLDITSLCDLALQAIDRHHGVDARLTRTARFWSKLGSRPQRESLVNDFLNGARLAWGLLPQPVTAGGGTNTISALKMALLQWFHLARFRPLGDRDFAERLVAENPELMVDVVLAMSRDAAEKASKLRKLESAPK